jgi:hypothetical protein
LESGYLNYKKQEKKSRIETYKKQLYEFCKPKIIPDLICVSHFKWIKLECYRSALSEKLNISNNCNSMNIISKAGGGSSFDNHKDSAFNFFERFLLFENDLQYINIIKKNKEILEISKKYIGM